MSHVPGSDGALVTAPHSMPEAAPPALRLHTAPEALKKQPARRGKVKPKKPAKNFPLTAHANGQWCKKIRGRQLFFGPWDYPWEARDEYLRLREFLEAGRTVAQARADAASAPSIAARARILAANGGAMVAGNPAGAARPEDVRLRDLSNQFLMEKKIKVQSGQLDVRSFSSYHATLKMMLQAFTADAVVAMLRPADFVILREKLSSGVRPNVAAGRIGRVRSFFKWGLEMGHLDRTPIYGPAFKKPKPREIRESRAQCGRRHLDRAEILALLERASPQLKAMILLGINFGFGNTDLAKLTRSVVDLDKGFVTYPRPKTGVQRRAALWSETVEALREVEKLRPSPTNPADGNLVFITRHGSPWVRCGELKSGQKGAFPVSICDSIAQEFAKLREEVGVSNPTAERGGGLGFYALRRTFRTIAEQTLQERGIRTVMGHSGGQDIAESYLKGPEDECLKGIADHVRNWLFGAAKPVTSPAT